MDSFIFTRCYFLKWWKWEVELSSPGVSFSNSAGPICLWGPCVDTEVHFHIRNKAWAPVNFVVLWQYSVPIKQHRKSPKVWVIIWVKKVFYWHKKVGRESEMTVSQVQCWAPSWRNCKIGVVKNKKKVLIRMIYLASFLNQCTPLLSLLRPWNLNSKNVFLQCIYQDKHPLK